MNESITQTREATTAGPEQAEMGACPGLDGRVMPGNISARVRQRIETARRLVMAAGEVTPQLQTPQGQIELGIIDRMQTSLICLDEVIERVGLCVNDKLTAVARQWLSLISKLGREMDKWRLGPGPLSRFVEAKLGQPGRRGEGRGPEPGQGDRRRDAEGPAFAEAAAAGRHGEALQNSEQMYMGVGGGAARERQIEELPQRTMQAMGAVQPQREWSPPPLKGLMAKLGKKRR